MPLITIKVDYFCKHFLQVKRMMQVPRPADNRVASPLKKKGEKFLLFCSNCNFDGFAKERKRRRNLEEVF